VSAAIFAAISFLAKLMIVGMFTLPAIYILWSKKNDRKRKANRLYDKK
jgi:hypothetical protein